MTDSFGKTTDGASSSTSSTDKIAASSATASANGTLTAGHARVWMSAAGSSATKLLIYADSAGAPGALLATSNEVTVTSTTEAVRDYTYSGANQIDITSGTTYWLALMWQDPGTPSVTFSRDNTASGRQEVSGFTYPSAPDPFGTGTVFTGPIDVWAETEPAPSSTTFPQVVSTATDANRFGSSVALTMPSGIVVGNLLLIVVAVDGSAGHNISGWTQVVESTTSTGGSRLAAWAKTATASNSATVTTSGSQAMAVFTHQISGWSGNLADVTGTANNPGSGSFAPNPPNHTAAFNRDNLWIAAGSGNGFPTQTAPTNYTNVVQVGAGGNVAQLCGARRELAAASENPGAFGQAYDSSVIQMTLSVPPAADLPSPKWRRTMPALLAR